MFLYRRGKAVRSPRGRAPARRCRSRSSKPGALSRYAATPRSTPDAGSGTRVLTCRSRSKQASKTSTRDSKSASQRGGERSHQGPGGPTKERLYEEAKKKNIDGRSQMNKDELRRALGR
ncbi:plasmid stabilization protein [Streptomyces lydicus]|uniref:plasmid stabilization protein n=1 Tax=Streptomyces lydicus TaxID=47763 RepID=UPI0037F1D5A6